MTIAEFSINFSLGLVSSLHCAQMCGPLVLSYSLPLGKQSKQQQLFSHLAYNTGRAITYSLLGAIAGLTGHSLIHLGNYAGIANAGAIVAGALMLIVGLAMLDWLPLAGLQKFNAVNFTMRLLRPVSRFLTAPTVSSKLGLGLLLGFLPCGLIYAALLKAMAAGTAFAGAMTMTAFALGTMSVLMLIGLGSAWLNFSKLRNWGVKWAAVSVALLGVLLLWRGFVTWPVAAATQAPHCH